MTYEKFVLRRSRFLKNWRAIRTQNENGDFSHGAAIYGPSCDEIVVFDNDEQKEKYRADYGAANA